MKIYQISGLGANHNAFKNLKLLPDFECIALPWLQPELNETLPHYAERIAEKINVNEPFLLMGLSFGGIITKEINEFLHPKFNFLISTVKSREELPALMKLSAATHLHKLIPSSFLTSDSLLSYSVFRKLYSARMPDMQEIFVFRDPYYLKWSMDRIVNWHNENTLSNFMHLHGNKDLVFPSSKIHEAVIVEGGTHVMVMNKGRKISELINQKLMEF